MKKIWIVLVSIVFIFFSGCTEHKEVETYTWGAPNWTSDGKIVFLEHHIIQEWEKDIEGWRQSGGSEEITLCEINNNGTGMHKIEEIDSNEFEVGAELGAISTSSAGNWVVLSIEDWRIGDHYPVMYVVNREGSQLEEVGSGRYPDFSPDAEKIVYEKKDNGIWVMDRDGSGDHQIIADEDARYPAWSPDGGRISYVLGDLFIADISGNNLDSLVGVRVDDPDWGPVDSNFVSFKDGYFHTTDEGWHHVGIFHLENGIVDTLEQFRIGDNPKISPEGNKFIAYDEDGYFVINRNGSNKWYLRP